MNKNIDNSSNTANPYNHPIIDIFTRLGGQFDHSPDFNNPNQRVPGFAGALNIVMTGSRRNDRIQLLNAGFPGANNHCHHTFSYAFHAATNTATCNVQLVNARTHIETYPHAGAVSQWNSANPFAPYRNAVIGNDEKIPVTSLFMYSEEELNEFESIYNIKIPNDFRDVYLKQTPVEKTHFTTNNGNEYYLYSLFPLLPVENSNEYADVGFVMNTIKNQPNHEQDTNNNNNFYPYGDDDCGNIFYRSCNTPLQLVYDHEEDQYFKLY